MQFATLQYIIIITCGALNTIAGLYVLASNPKRSVNRVFAIFAFGVALWNLGLSLLFFTRNEIFISLILEGGLLLSIGIFFFGKVFPTKRLYSRDLLLVTPALLIAILVPMNVFISGVTFTERGYIVPHNEPLFLLYMAVAAFYMLGGAWRLLKQYLRSKGKVREQLCYFILGTILFTLTSLICDAILPAFGIFELNLVGPVASLVFVAVTAYSIFRYQLLDIRIVIQRSLIYTVLLSLIIACYMTLISGLAVVFQIKTNASAVLAAGITTIVGIFGAPILSRLFRKWTDSLFFKDSYDYGRTLNDLSKALRVNLSQADIIKSSSKILECALRPEFVEFWLAESDTEPRHAADAAVSFPIVFEERRIGLLFLGPKRSGDAYSPRDMQLLETFSYQAAVALEKGRLFKQVEEYNEQLEEIVEKRTDEIRKMQEDQKQAMIDISHNLQTPLAIIRGQLELLRSEDSEDTDADAMRRSLDRVSAFIRQLLHLAKLDHSLFKVELAPIDLADLVRSEVEYFEVMADEKGVRLLAKTPERLTVLGNKKLLEELLVNLVSNAIRYRSPDRPGTVYIELAENADNITLSVRDNGRGIAEEDMPELFTRYYRSAHGKDSPNGTGLGLAISKKIVERHGGSVRAESTLGVGSTFTVTLPKQKNPA